MKKIFLLIFVFGIFQISCAAQKNSGDEYAKIKAEKFVKISEIKSQNLAPGIYETEGFVAKIYTCPKCPPNAVCKPCMKDNIVVSEESRPRDTYDLSDKEIIIFTNQTKSFERSNKYFLKIKITDKKTTSEQINDVELLAFKPAEN